MATDTYQEGDTMTTRNDTLADFPIAFGGGFRVCGTEAGFTVERYDTDNVVNRVDTFAGSGEAMRHALDRSGWLTAVEAAELRATGQAVTR